MENAHEILMGLASIVVLGMAAQWLAWRLRLPSILLLLVAGFVAGPVTHLIEPDVLFGDLLFPVVSLSVAVILFEGGLSLQIRELREIGGALVCLLTIGVLATWSLSTLGAWFLLDFPPSMAVLLGAVLVVTGPTVVGPLLRHIRPEGRIDSVAKWEGIMIDPIGAVLAVLVFEANQAIESAGVAEAAQQALVGFLKTGLIGGAIGMVGALPVLALLKRYWIPDSLQSPVLVAVVLGTFTAANLIEEESGLIAVTLLGVILGNQGSAVIKPLIEFKENLRVLLVSGLFILLSARLEWSQMSSLSWQGLAFLTFLILIVRPVAVLLSTGTSELSWRERAFLAWMAPRGIVAASVASVFALRLGPEGEALVAATFLVIVGTVTIYGLSAAPLAYRLGLAQRNPQGVLFASAHPGARAIAKTVQDAGYKVLLIDNNPANIRAARMEGMPTYYASILAEQTMGDIELGGIGRFLALTPNDEVNSLAALHFSEIFSRAGVYQLVPAREGGGRTGTASHHLHGRFLFGPDVTYSYLDQRFAHGAVVRATKLTAEFDFAAFRDYYGPSALVLFVRKENGILTVCTAEEPPKAEPGQTLISLVEPDDDTSNRG